MDPLECFIHNFNVTYGRDTSYNIPYTVFIFYDRDGKNFNT